MIPSIRLYLEFAAALILVIAFGVYTHHERVIGQEELQHSVDAATRSAEAQARADTVKLQAMADAAHMETIDAQKKFSDYLAANPIGPIRLCIPTGGSRPSVPPAARNQAGPADTAPTAGNLPTVPAGAPQPDISRGLSAIVRSAGALAIGYREFQTR